MEFQVLGCVLPSDDAQLQREHSPVGVFSNQSSSSPRLKTWQNANYASSTLSETILPPSPSRERPNPLVSKTVATALRVSPTQHQS